MRIYRHKGVWVSIRLSVAAILALLWLLPGFLVTERSAHAAGVSAQANIYEGLWIGEMTKKASVRSGPGPSTKVIKSWWAGRRVLLYNAIPDGSGGFWHRVSESPEAPMYVHSSTIRKVMAVQFEGARFAGRWVNVNVSQQVVTAYEDGVPVKVTLASTGTSKNPTELGTWKIAWRLPKKDMTGGSKAKGDYYYLKNVPYPQYFHNSGEALHGTYWHDNFGRPLSHGCVNLSTPMAKWFYGWAGIGTVVYVHK
jgi:lipoprotein-anchoring transpeptidase ErfK/SrfK